MYGIIDIGSNTIRLSCYKLLDGELEYVFHKKRMVGLARYVDEDGKLSEKGINRAIMVLQDFKKIISGIDMKKLYVIATASFRNVSNTEEIINEIKEKTDLEVKVISGDEEAISDFIGATFLNNVKDGMLIDIGGGSTEMVFYQDNIINKTVSVPIGSLNIYTKHISEMIPSKDEMKKIKSYINKILDEVNHVDMAEIGLGVGGSNRAVCKLYNDIFELSNDNIVMEFSKLKEILKLFKRNPEEGISKVLQVATDRVHTIVPGLLILITIMKRYECREIQISKWGLREGYLIKNIVEKDRA